MADEGPAVVLLSKGRELRCVYLPPRAGLKCELYVNGANVRVANNFRVLSPIGSGRKIGLIVVEKCLQRLVIKDVSNLHFPIQRVLQTSIQPVNLDFSYSVLPFLIEIKEE